MAAFDRPLAAPLSKLMAHGAVFATSAVTLSEAWDAFDRHVALPRSVPGRCHHCAGDVRSCSCRKEHRALQLERKAARKRRRAASR